MIMQSHSMDWRNNKILDKRSIFISKTLSLHSYLFKPTVNSGSEIVQAKHILGRNTLCSTLIAKSRSGRIFFELLQHPFKGSDNMKNKMHPDLPVWQCHLAGGS